MRINNLKAFPASPKRAGVTGASVPGELRYAGGGNRESVYKPHERFRKTYPLLEMPSAQLMGHLRELIRNLADAQKIDLALNSLIMSTERKFNILTG